MLDRTTYGAWRKPVEEGKRIAQTLVETPSPLSLLCVFLLVTGSRFHATGFTCARPQSNRIVWRGIESGQTYPVRSGTFRQATVFRGSILSFFFLFPCTRLMKVRFVSLNKRKTHSTRGKNGVPILREKKRTTKIAVSELLLHALLPDARTRNDQRPSGTHNGRKANHNTPTDGANFRARGR